MNAALLMVVFCATLLVVVSANRVENRAMRYANEGSVMAKSSILSRQRRSGISVSCTIRCSDYWVCRAKKGFVLPGCRKPRDCDCTEFDWQNSD
uniref:Uncharacterized protein n=1 Tax=Plectus sambesii TaxID=2011161 RepID=A0A914VPM1_9BILA